MVFFHKQRHRRNRSHLYLSLHLHGMWGVFLNEFFRRIATSLIGLFIPIYILEVTGDFINVLLYFLAYAITASATEYVGARLIRRVGVDWGMAVGSLFRFLFIVLLIFAENQPIMFLFSAMSFGLSQPFDWLPFHYVVAKVSKKVRHFGKAASYSWIVTQIAAAISPVIGGFVIYWFGYTTLYMIAASFLLVSACMAFLDDFKKSGMHVSGKEVIERFGDPGIWKHIFAFGVKGWDSFVYVMFWPVFLYTTVGNVQTSGSVQTLSLIVAMIATFLTGKFVDKKNFKMMRPGAFLVSLTWWARVFARSSFLLFLVDMLYNVGYSIIWTPHDALLYSRSVKKYTMEFILVRELMSYLVIVFNILVMLVIYSVFKSYILMFVLASLVAVITLKVPRIYIKYMNNLKTE